MIRNEDESGQEYFKFEDDPHKEMKDQIAQYSENYTKDRYYVYHQTKEFLFNDYNKGKCNFFIC